MKPPANARDTEAQRKSKERKTKAKPFGQDEQDERDEPDFNNLDKLCFSLLL